MSKTKTISDKIFEEQMNQEEQIFDKVYDLIKALKEDKISNWKVKGNQHKLIHELDNLLFQRHESMCAHSVVDRLESKK
jgi:hypothetical protein